jgi:hypothetical protein
VVAVAVTQIILVVDLAGLLVLVLGAGPDLEAMALVDTADVLATHVSTWVVMVA